MEEHAPAVAFPIAFIIAAAVFGIGGAAVGWYYLSSAVPVSQPARQREIQRGADDAGPEPTVGAVQDR